MPANTVPSALLSAAVNSHFTDPQGKWCTSSQTDAMINALSMASGIPHHIARLAVMEIAVDRWMVCVEETCRAYLRQNTAADPLYVKGYIPTKMRTDPISVSGFGTIVTEWCEWQTAIDWLAPCQTFQQRRVVFYRWLKGRLDKSPSLLARYTEEAADVHLSDIAEVLAIADKIGGAA